jgi:hypothetical protein
LVHHALTGMIWSTPLDHYAPPILHRQLDLRC